jgi:hypothetical protein
VNFSKFFLIEQVHNELKENTVLSSLQWLRPMILATQEADIRRIAVQGQPRQTVQETQLQQGSDSDPGGSSSKKG